MAKVILLTEGYIKKIDGNEYASSSITLIRDKEINVLVDPGMDRALLLDGLKREGLSVLDINYVVLTHNHPDHCLLVGVFEKAEVLDYEFIYSFNGKMVKNINFMVPGTKIEIVYAPGHADGHCCVLVDTQDLGRVAVAGDLFWWTDKQEQKLDRKSLAELNDPYVKNKGVLRKCRERIMMISDYIIPGHGKPFKVKK